MPKPTPGLLPILAFLLTPLSAAAETVIGGPLSIDELCQRAELVLIGRVVAVAGEWNDARTVIQTRVQVVAEESLKGPARAKERVELVQLGGKVGEITSAVGGAPSFSVGERVLLFISRKPDGVLGLVGQFQGKFQVETDPVTKAELAVRRLPGLDKVLDRIPLDQARFKISQGPCRSS
jgi:hypothetical protein